MSEPVSDLSAMLAGMEPQLHPSPYRFIMQNRADGAIAKFDHTFAVIRETEGTTFIVKSEEASEAGDESPDFARITLAVHSALDGVGLTAAVARGLADQGIPCNVIAAFHHDHLFVPWDRREQALATLTAIAQDARR
ncbi:ACT domain-containing protein [Erythrobacter insulae]|uniref:ACT domain-containing protein n=1 Tax=Erythrobacter insulae TaxID=2584124 RepID=A0A547P9W3_9SPHN|nr:ACT domain-containing protein [Erythrobacter insulae]TRD10887.1 ACT domain-containing protein [Erythrobacter insulae]